MNPTPSACPAHLHVLLTCFAIRDRGGGLLPGAGTGAPAPHGQMLAVQTRLLLQFTLSRRKDRLKTQWIEHPKEAGMLLLRPRTKGS